MKVTEDAMERRFQQAARRVQEARREALAVQILCAMMQGGGTTWSYDSMQLKALEVTDSFMEKLDEQKS